MLQPALTDTKKQLIKSHFESRLMMDQDLARYSVMQVGGPADFLVIVESGQDLEDAVRFLWLNDVPFILLGQGSNTLISDKGIRELVVVNRAKKVRYLDQDSDFPQIWAESGASFGKLARLSGAKGWSGLEWCAGIPGTVGGAVVNNAGAFGSDVAHDLAVAEILHQSRRKIQRTEWSVDQFDYGYRMSAIKSGKLQAVVLNATFGLRKSTPEAVKKKISDIADRRQASQPQGASLGSMFKNPPGDYSGRLIEQAGLKGTRVGDVEISEVHGNFFINHGDGTAADIAALIEIARQAVKDQFEIELELEIQFIGDWGEGQQ